MQQQNSTRGTIHNEYRERVICSDKYKTVLAVIKKGDAVAKTDNIKLNIYCLETGEHANI